MMSSGHHRSISSQDRVPLGLSIRNHSYPRRHLSQLVLESEAPLGERSSQRIVDVVVLELAEVPWCRRRWRWQRCTSQPLLQPSPFDKEPGNSSWVAHGTSCHCRNRPLLSLVRVDRRLELLERPLETS